MTDDRLAAALRAAMPPVDAGRAEPARDLWPLIASGPTPRRSRWSWTDVGLAAAAIVTLLLRPDLILVLAWHF